MKKIFTLLTLIVVCVGFTSCGDENENIIGKWKYVYPSGMVEVLEFKSDNTGVNEITIKEEGSTITSSYTFDYIYDSEEGTCKIRNCESPITNDGTYDVLFFSSTRMDFGGITYNRQ